MRWQAWTDATPIKLLQTGEYKCAWGTTCLFVSDMIPGMLSILKQNGRYSSGSGELTVNSKQVGFFPYNRFQIHHEKNVKNYWTEIVAWAFLVVLAAEGMGLYLLWPLKVKTRCNPGASWEHILQWLLITMQSERKGLGNREYLWNSLTDWQVLSAKTHVPVLAHLEETFAY